MGPYTFTLADADGAEHVYTIIAPHKAQAGAAIMFELSGMLAGPLAPLLAGLVGKSGADLDAIGAAVGPELGKAIVGLGDLRLVHRILTETLRDGKQLGPSGAPLANFNEAYQRNYGELLAALWEVVKYNRFLSLPAGMSSALTRAAKQAAANIGRGAGTSSGPPPSA